MLSNLVPEKHTLHVPIKMEYKLQYKCVKNTNEMVSVQLCHGDFFTTNIPKIKMD